MADPVKEQILANIVTTLEGISTGGGYYTNAGHRVLKYLEGWQQPDGDLLPCLYVVAGNESPPTFALGGSCYRSEVEISVWSYVEQKPGADDLGDQLAKVEADIKVAMMTDLTRGALAESQTLMGVSTDEGFYGEGNRGAVVATFSVKYSWSLTAP